MFQFSRNYFYAALLLFIIEVLIALYAHDAIIRPYGGDLLVVIFIYCFIKGFINSPVRITAIGVLLFSYLIEISQYFQLVAFLGLADSRLANVIMGNSFAWIDLLAYTLGIIIVVIAEDLNARKKIIRLAKRFRKTNDPSD